MRASKSGHGGDMDALFKLGQMYRYGEGAKVDCKTAVATLSKVCVTCDGAFDTRLEVPLE